MISRLFIFSLTALLLLVLVAVLPVLWVYRMWLRFRHGQYGACLTCGHDVGAGNDRCPNCESPVAS